MDELSEFFRNLFATDLWPARWHCGRWTDFHGWLYILSDIAIWASYFAIPVIILWYLTRKSGEPKFTSTYLLFAAFILLCGSSHLMDAMMFWVPMYRLNALIRFSTAVVSLFTVYHLIRILPNAFKEKTSFELEKEISRREVAERQLAEANEGLQAFASMASHDLQEPLRKISTYAARLYEKNKDVYDGSSQQLFEKITETVNRMNRLMADTMNLSSLSKDLELIETDLNEVLNQTRNELELKITSSQALIESDLLPKVLGHKEYLVQVFNNLINNAIKFTEDKPGIRITSEIRGDSVIINISDNGIGMKQSETETIFTPFHRLNSRSDYEGSGLGLSIVKRIIDIHKGKIDVISTPGSGTTFSLTLQKS